MILFTLHLQLSLVPLIMTGTYRCPAAIARFTHSTEFEHARTIRMRQSSTEVQEQDFIPNNHNCSGIHAN